MTPSPEAMMSDDRLTKLESRAAAMNKTLDEIEGTLDLLVEQLAFMNWAGAGRIGKWEDVKTEYIAHARRRMTRKP